MNQYLKLFSVILLLLINQAAVSQQLQQAFLESYSSTGTQEMFYKTSVIRGADGFIYVCGATLNLEGNYDMLITKMTSLNLVVWTKQYAGLAAGDDFAADIVQDGAGNIIITGTEYISSTNYNAVTIKYNSSGALQWVKSYNGAGNSFDGGMSVVRDVSNNIYICGGSYGTTTLSDFLCIKYNSDGVEQWANTWNSTGLQDISSRLAVSATQVSVIGASQQSSTDWKMATTFFNVNTGVFLGAKLTGGDDEGIDKVADLTIDGDDNTYVVGAVRNINKAYDIKVIKLSPTYTVLWQQTYNGPANLNDEGLALELTSTNDLVICGYTTNIGEDKNLITTKYAGSNGALIWSKTYDEQNGEDRATDLKLDLNGNAIICGSSFKDGNLDYVVQKLKSSNGDLIWANRWNSDNNSDDMPMSIAIDENNNVVYVAGQSSDGNGSYTYNVTRWIQKEVYMPMPIDGFSSSSGYIQNKKQLRNEDGSANASVKFYSQQKGPATYVDDDKISYVFYTPAADTLETDTIHRVDMKFNKGNTHAPVYPISERAEYANFYLGHMPEKAERTRIFNAVVKLNAYNNTDIIYDNNNCGYRHWIVARNGAPIGDFEMEYTGLTSLSLDVNGNLVIETSIGNQVQLKANAYSMNNASGMLTILPWQPDYYINGNKVTFSNIGSWNGTLVFEMKQAAGGGNSPIENAELEWSTYFGGAGKDFLCDVVAEANGRSWTVGSSTSIVFPLIPGIAVLNNLNAESDAIITSFQPNCSINWLTYYGGSLDDIATAIALTDIGWPVVVGYTESEDLPDEADGNLDDSTLGGIKDGFIVRLFPNGFIMLDSYIGGD